MDEVYFSQSDVISTLITGRQDLTEDERLLLRLKIGVIPAAEVIPARWTSVDEALPKCSGTYIVAYARRGTVLVSFARFYKKWWSCGGHGEVKPTHWMPLPEPPTNAKGGSDEGK